MKFFRYLPLALMIAGCSAVHHVPPGQSAAFSIAKKAELVALPAPPEPPQSTVPVALPQAELPDTEKVADAFILGNLCMEQGHYADAVAAYETALKLNPQFAEAWSKLAVAYQNLGEEKKSLEAFKKFKTASMQ